MHPKKAFYSATEDTIKVIGRIFVEICSEGWLAESVEFFIAVGGQRDIIGRNALPQLGIEVRQNRHLVQ